MKIKVGYVVVNWLGVGWEFYDLLWNVINMVRI